MSYRWRGGKLASCMCVHGGGIKIKNERDAHEQKEGDVKRRIRSVRGVNSSSGSGSVIGPHISQHLPRLSLRLCAIGPPTTALG